MKTLVVGHVTADVVEEGVVPGGCVLYAAHAHKALEAKVRIHTAYRKSDLPSLDLRDIGVRAQHVMTTTRFVNRYPEGEPRVQFIEAQAPSLHPIGNESWDVVHLAPVMGEVDLAEWLQAQPARMIGVGLQGWLRAPLGVPGRVAPRPIEFEPSLLRQVDLACCSEEDLEGHDGLIAMLRCYVPVVVVTYGSKGCVVWKHGRPRGFGTYGVDEVDPTGAGDTFAAAMLQGLARGGSIDASARMAAAFASSTVECRGVPPVPALQAARHRSRSIRAA